MPVFLRHRARRLGNRLKPASLVLCYHRVSDETSDRWRNAVSVRDFESQVKFLRERYAIISVDELAQAVERGSAPGFRSVAITFDDGYAVNLRTACDILLRYRAPATFYLNTAWLDSELFWWDDLALSLAAAESRHGDHPPLAWFSREARVPDDEPIRPAGAFESIRSALKIMPEAERRELLRRFRAAFGVPDGHHADYAPMSRGDIKTLAAEPAFTVAAHSHSHSCLATLPEDGQRAEILENKRVLEGLAGKPLSHFSYPFGAARDFNEATVGAVRAAGFRTAATTEGIPVRWPADAFRLPRLSAKTWDARRLAGHVRDAWARS